MIFGIHVLQLFVLLINCPEFGIGGYDREFGNPAVLAQTIISWNL
jgi:hypothetical protein